MSRSIASRPQPSVTGLRPTVTRILSAGSVVVLPSAASTSSAPPVGSEPFRLGAGQHRRRRVRAGAWRPAASARRHIAAGCAPAPRRPSPRRPAWRRRCRARARYSRRRRRRACSGTSVSASASVDEITLPPKGRNGSSTGAEPVAITICSARITCRPVSVSTSTVLPSRKRAQPVHDLDPRPLQQPGDAAVEAADDAVLPGDRLARDRASGLRGRDAERAVAGRQRARPSRTPRPHGSAPWRGCSRH